MRFTRGFESALYGLCVLHTVLGGKQGEAYVVPLSLIHIEMCIRDSYGRGRIIGDYRRVALYGIDALAEEKRRDLDALDGPMTEERIRLREEVSEQIRALGKIKVMAARYGVDISRPAKDAKEAVQFLYMAYLAGIKANTMCIRERHNTVTRLCFTEAVRLVGAEQHNLPGGNAVLLLIADDVQRIVQCP